MITLYHAANTRSLRVLWLLNELGLEFELKTLPFTPDALKDPAYLKLNPFARVPALVDGDTGLFESGAILEYLLATYGNGRLMPDTDSAQYGVYLQWFHFAEATLMPPLSATELLIGYVFGGVARGLAVAGAAGLLAFSSAGVWPAQPLWLIWFAFAGATLMSLLGILAGLISQKFDQMNAFANFVIMPLSFLSGTFYSLDALPEGLATLVHFNPIFWLIDGFRHGALGVSDGSPWIGFAVTLAVIAALTALCWRVFDRGWRLKP